MYSEMIFHVASNELVHVRNCSPICSAWRCRNAVDAAASTKIEAQSACHYIIINSGSQVRRSCATLGQPHRSRDWAASY